MKVILLKDVQKIGRKYDIKNVADGYALNMLIPKGLAQIATAQSIKNVEVLKAQDAAEKKIQGDLLLKNLQVIGELELHLKERANEKGHLFAGVTKEMLISEIHKVARLNIDPDSIKLPKPIKETGEHKITVEAVGKKVEFTVIIEATK